MIEDSISQTSGSGTFLICTSYMSFSPYMENNYHTCYKFSVKLNFKQTKEICQSSHIVFFFRHVLMFACVEKTK